MLWLSKERKESGTAARGHEPAHRSLWSAMIASSGQFDLEGLVRTWAEIRAERIVGEEKAAAYGRIMDAAQRVYGLIVEAAGGGEGPEQDEFFGDAASPCGWRI